ncbi:unnamed protein product [Brachionus calyciflorus]|uniref:Uncharacterized protein n=1 Tax=Brachionus calyciflorus TaxID=104777 RepID=A0A813P2D0_9BILA|nr:unnamed protein product [Brachionus calyciflorus]
MLNSNFVDTDDYEFVYPKRTAPIPYSQSPSLKKYSLSLYSPLTQSPSYDTDSISKSVMLGIPRYECPLPGSKPDIHQYPKPILKKVDETYDENLYKNGSFFCFENIQEEFENDKDEENENENVFGAALEEMKGKNDEWSVNCFNPELPRFNYVSLMFDEIETFNPNTSINTRILASKYLKNKEDFDQSIFLPKLQTNNLFQLYNPYKEIDSKQLVYKSVSSSSGQDSGNFEGEDTDSEDEDIWLFGKPTIENVEKKNKKITKEHDNKNEDEEDDDYVLDIDKLKQLPKLL